MDTKQLITFMTLAEEQNYLKTAERLSYAPSTLAKHIQLLENEFGVRLVEHREGKIQLTREGEQFKEFAQKMLCDYWEAEEAFAETAQLGGVIRIGGGEPIVGFNLSDFLMQFDAMHPKVSFNVHMICCARVPAWLRSRELDIGFLHELEIISSEEFETVPLYCEPIFLAARGEDPLAERDAVLPADLMGRKFAFTYEDCCFTAEFRRRLKRLGIQPGSELFLGSLSAILNCVRQEGRICLIPETSLPKVLETGGLTTLNWRGEPLRAWVQILYLKNHVLTPAEKELVRQAKEYAAGLIEAKREALLRN